MSVGRYSALTVGLALVSLAFAWAFLGDEAVRQTVALGAGLCVLNSVAAHALAARARRQASLKAFMLLVLGGMGLRLALLLVAVSVLPWLLALPQPVLLRAVLAYFGLFLLVELVVLQLRPGQARVEAR